MIINPSLPLLHSTITILFDKSQSKISTLFAHQREQFEEEAGGEGDHLDVSDVANLEETAARESHRLPRGDLAPDAQLEADAHRQMIELDQRLV